MASPAFVAVMTFKFAIVECVTKRTKIRGKSGPAVYAPDKIYVVTYIREKKMKMRYFYFIDVPIYIYTFV